MRVLHAAFLTSPIPSIFAQMLGEQVSADQLGLPWEVRVFYRTQSGGELVWNPRTDQMVTEPERPPSIALRAWAHRKFFRWLLSIESEFDLVLLRYAPHDPWLARYLRVGETPVALVFHTNHISLESNTNYARRSITQAIDSAVAASAKRRKVLSVAVTRELAESIGVSMSTTPPVIYPNGIDLSSWNELPDFRSETPTVVLIASQPQPWQGVDRLLDWASALTGRIEVDLVGELNDTIASRAHATAGVRVHGWKPPDEVRAISSRAWVGASALAMDRNAMSEACPLKVREYLAGGLPVVATHGDVFPTHFPYFRRLPLQGTGLLEYLNQMRAVSRTTVRNCAAPLISKSSRLAALYEDLQHARRTRG